MMNSNTFLKIFFILIICTQLLLLSSKANALDCSQSQLYFNDALLAGQSQDWTAAKQLLSQSVALCNIFDNWYLLGQTEFELNNMQAAASAFEDARNYANSEDQRALAIARYAQVKAKQGELGQALKLLHIARNMSSPSPAWMTALALALDKKRSKQPLTVSAVTGTLNNTTRSIKIFKLDAKASINVNIHFEYNSVDLVDSSIGSIDVLAEALSDASFKNKSITIIGHSDSRGTESYNYELSTRRANKVLQTILALKPDLQDRLTVEGLGEQLPLYAGTTEDIYLLNRRIEVQLNQ